MSSLTSCNSYYPGDISCNLFTECLYQNCPLCVDCIALSGCSVLSTILSTQTSCNFTILLTFPVICLLNACFKELPCLHYYLALIVFSVLSTICKRWICKTLIIQLPLPVICLLNTYFKDCPICIEYLGLSACSV